MPARPGQAGRGPGRGRAPPRAALGPGRPKERAASGLEGERGSQADQGRVEGHPRRPGRGARRARGSSEAALDVAWKPLEDLQKPIRGFLGRCAPSLSGRSRSREAANQVSRTRTRCSSGLRAPALSPRDIRRRAVLGEAAGAWREASGRWGWYLGTTGFRYKRDLGKLRKEGSEVFAGFERARIEAQGATINAVYGGEGPPVLLLHGYPQTLAMWHPVAPRLAERFTVVATDLRGYGDSSKPPAGEDHAGYSKRAMADDQVQAMEALGFERFAVVGHDRGGRVGHRMALDHRDRVSKLAVLDIIPTREVFATVDKDLAAAYYHWFFLSQPYDLPEKLIGCEPVYYLHKKLGWLGTDIEVFASEALAEYERCFRDPRMIPASCEDYRAAA